VRAGEVKNVSILVAIGVNEEGYREALGGMEGAKEDKDAAHKKAEDTRLTEACSCAFAVTSSNRRRIRGNRLIGGMSHFVRESSVTAYVRKNAFSSCQGEGQRLWDAPKRHLDLFSGIGGFALAARMVGGIETVAFCERDPYAQAVLKKHWPHVPICDDIHKMRGDDYGTINIVTGGFPCQPYSLAGQRRGNEDDRALWPQMLRIIREARPTWVLGENVAGIVSLALDGVLADLEAEGYACQAFVIPAYAVGAYHRRDRVWIVGHAQVNRMEGERAGGKQVAPGNAGEKVSMRPGETVADSDGFRLEAAWTEQQPARTARKSVDVVESTGAVEPDWAGGTVGQPWPVTDFEWPSRREVERDFHGMAYGVSDRVDRIRALGNAIVPQVACEIMRCMLLCDKENTHMVWD
jgi:DNA (cytosine-5)-methyltransferase 1